MLRTETLLKDQAIELARKLGIARTRDFAGIGVSRHYLCKLCSEGVLTRAGYGRYAAPKEAAWIGPSASESPGRKGRVS